MKTLLVSEFKTHCVGVLNEVANTGTQNNRYPESANKRINDWSEVRTLDAKKWDSWSQSQNESLKALLRVSIAHL